MHCRGKRQDIHIKFNQFMKEKRISLLHFPQNFTDAAPGIMSFD